MENETYKTTVADISGKKTVAITAGMFGFFLGMGLVSALMINSAEKPKTNPIVKAESYQR